MFRLNFTYNFIALVMLCTCWGFSAQAELSGEWRPPIVTPLTDPLEIRAADMETYIDPNDPVVPIAVLGINPGGGTNLGIYDAFPYLNTPIPDLPPQNVVDNSFRLLDIGTNNIFGIDGIVGNTAGVNHLAACIDDLLQIIKFDNDGLVIVEQIADSPCNEASITGVPGIPDRFYASKYDANAEAIDVYLSEDGGDSWNPFYQITQNFGGIPVGAANGGVRHDITGFNTANDPDAVVIRAGLCVNYTEALANGPGGLIYGVKCIEAGQFAPNNFFSQNFDQGFFPLDTIAELRSRSTRNSEIATIYPKETEEAIQRLRNWDFSSVDGLGSTPNTTDPLLVAPDTSDLPVVTANLLLVGVAGDIFYFAQEDDQRVIFIEEDNPFSNPVVRQANIRNYPCNQSTDNIVTPIGIGGFVDNNVYKTFIACPGGSLLISELLLSPPAGVPTLNEWGLIALMSLIVLFGALALRRKSQATNN